MSQEAVAAGGIQTDEDVIQPSESALDLTLNCSRIGITGGLRSYAEQVMEWLSVRLGRFDAVLPVAVSAPKHLNKISTPTYLASSSGVSFVRPLAWLAYGQFQFPVPSNRRILCTTHHVLPRHRHQIVTVHDLRPYFFPDNVAQRFYFHTMLPRMLRRCEGILTVSETSREALMDVYGLSESAIRVVPNALRFSQTAAPPPACRPQGNLEEPYLLVVGATWPHKNAEEVLQMHTYWAPHLRLKLIAGRGAYRTKLQDLARMYRISGRVDFLPAVTPDQLQDLYQSCTALIYPSRMEGFGLPPLEAMSVGKPVIVSDIAVFREIYGPHAVYVSLGSEASWARAFRSLRAIQTPDLVRASAHARSYDIDRMGNALEAALRYFWGESWAG